MIGDAAALSYMMKKIMPVDHEISVHSADSGMLIVDIITEDMSVTSAIDVVHAYVKLSQILKCLHSLVVDVVYDELIYASRVSIALTTVFEAQDNWCTSLLTGMVVAAPHTISQDYDKVSIGMIAQALKMKSTVKFRYTPVNWLVTYAQHMCTISYEDDTWNLTY